MASGAKMVTDAAGARGQMEALPRRGERLVVVTLDDGRRGEIPKELLKRDGGDGYRLDVTFDQLFAAKGAPATERLVVPVVEEELAVGKRKTRAKTRVSKSVATHTAVVDEPYTEEEVTIERVPVGRVVATPVATRVEGETTVIPIHEEEVVVTRRWILREEIRVTKRTVERQARKQVVLRREEPHIERSSE